MAVFDIIPPHVRSHLRKYESPTNFHPSDLQHSFVVSLALAAVLLFAWWWFNPAHIPANFVGTTHILDVVLFLLVSYVLWRCLPGQSPCTSSPSLTVRPNRE
jgi:MFS superfamily sulfate permease-like transporter